MKHLTLGSGILALLIGIFLFIHPFTTTAMIGWIIALLVFISGLASLFIYTNNPQKSIWQLLQSILSIVFGIILLSSSAMSLSSVVITLAAYWILISGFLRFIGGMQVRQLEGKAANHLLVSAIIAILIGLFFLFNPTLSAIFIGRFTGLLLMVGGLSGILVSLRMT